MKALAAALALGLAGCARQKSGDIPAVRFGTDLCARCGMLVSEERFASGYVDSQGRSVIYDDVGEFLEAARERPELARISYVHDAEDGRWLRASEAFFVHIPALATPMGTGFAATGSEDRARAFGKRFNASDPPQSLLAGARRP